MKQKFKSVSGVTLVEILIGVVISMVMMAALYTSYNVVNNSYSQVTDRAKISRTGRDISGMLLRDIRMAGYFDIKSMKIASDEMYPLIITKSKNFSGNSRKCDKIDIVYGDIEYKKNANPEYTYPIYKITYECKNSLIPDRKKPKNAGGSYPSLDLFAIYKSKISWDRNGKQWNTDATTDNDPKTYNDELIIDYVEDLIFNPINEKGLMITPVPTASVNQDNLYKIKSVDVSIVIRSGEDFYKNQRERTVYSLSDNTRNKKQNDRYLRDSIIVTAHSRNIGVNK